MDTTPNKGQNPNPNSSYIRYPRFRELHREIKRCQELSKVSADPQCMSLEGESGAGKTTLILDYASAFPSIETEEGMIIPVLYAPIPSPATVKATASAVLQRLGDPGAEKGTLWSMNNRIVGLIKDCKVELVILDEFSNLVDSETNHIINAVSDWLKMLIKETGVPFLVVGIDSKVSEILQANLQLSRLFACRERLEPFVWGNHMQIGEFARFMEYASKAVNMELSTNLPKYEINYRIFYSTNGVVGNIMNLMRYAAMLAREKSRDKITLDDLSLAFTKRLSKHIRNKLNPFTVSEDETFQPPHKGDEDKDTGKGKKKTGKKKP